MIDVVQSYGFDGVDFDIEDPLPSNTTAETFASQLLSFLQQVRAGLPSSLISITIPGQSWGQYWQYLAQEVAATPGLVDYINFMEYDIWINPSLPSTSNQYQQQIMADITTYTSPTTTAPAPNYAPGWGLPVPLVQTGLMGGYDDLGHYLTPEASSNLSSMAEDLGLYGIMFWDLDRDAGTNASPPTTDQPPYTYSDTIRSSLLNPISTSRFTPAKSTKASFSKNCGRQTLFLKYLPPPHGAPAH